MDAYGAVRRIETDARLDDVAAAIEQKVPAALREGRLRETLSGTWLGHALHPLLTDVPIGTWTSALLLDLIGGERWRPASTTLTAIGLAAALPTAASGVVDWLDTQREPRRLGVVHAAANTTATVCFAASLAGKLAGRPRLGRTAAVVGASALGVGGYLGGHLSYARGAGVDRAVAQRGREDTFEVERVVGGDVGTVVTREAAGDRYVIVGDAEDRVAVIGWCTRCGTTLEIVSPGVLRCPVDDSRFGALTSTVEQGPATTPLPTFEVVEEDGAVRLRRPV